MGALLRLLGRKKGAKNFFSIVSSYFSFCPFFSLCKIKFKLEACLQFFAIFNK